jgi:hypothetical protein
MGKFAQCYLCYSNNVAPICCTPDGDQWKEAIEKNDDSKIAFDAIVPCWDACYVLCKSDPSDTPYQMCHEVIPCCTLCDSNRREKSVIGQTLSCCCNTSVCCCVLLALPVPCITLPMYRFYVRRLRQIEGSLCNDCVQSWLCYPCTLRLAAYTFDHDDEFKNWKPPAVTNSMETTTTTETSDPTDPARVEINLLDHKPSFQPRSSTNVSPITKKE